MSIQVFFKDIMSKKTIILISFIVSVFIGALMPFFAAPHIPFVRYECTFIEYICNIAPFVGEFYIMPGYLTLTGANFDLFFVEILLLISVIVVGVMYCFKRSNLRLIYFHGILIALYFFPILSALIGSYNGE